MTLGLQEYLSTGSVSGDLICSAGKGAEGREGAAYTSQLVGQMANMANMARFAHEGLAEYGMLPPPSLQK